MPAAVKKVSRGRWAICDKDTGKVKRDASKHGWRPSRKRRGRR